MPTHLVVWNFFPDVPFSKTRDIPGEESSLVPTTEFIVAGHDKQAAQILPFLVVQITAGIYLHWNSETNYFSNKLPSTFPTVHPRLLTGGSDHPQPPGPYILTGHHNATKISEN